MLCPEGISAQLSAVFVSPCYLSTAHRESRAVIYTLSHFPGEEGNMIRITSMMFLFP